MASVLLFQIMRSLPVDWLVYPLPPPTDFVPMDRIFTYFNGIVQIINSLKVYSPCGIDNMNSKILHNTSLASGLFLTKIFQQSLETGVVPDDWRTGNIIPVHKGGTKIPT